MFAEPVGSFFAVHCKSVLFETVHGPLYTAFESCGERPSLGQDCGERGHHLDSRRIAGHCLSMRSATRLGLLGWEMHQYGMFTVWQQIALLKCIPGSMALLRLPFQHGNRSSNSHTSILLNLRHPRLFQKAPGIRRHLPTKNLVSPIPLHYTFTS